jgi:hypothetical protein
MIHPSIIEARLGELRFRTSRWFQAEIRELQNILMDHEKIIALATGRYFGSFALLVATDQRLLLVDKRVFFMNLEDTRYDMIAEIDFNNQAFNATVTIHTLNKTHKFTSYKHRTQLRELTNYVQRRIMELRTQQTAVPMPGSVLSQLPPSMRKQNNSVYNTSSSFQQSDNQDSGVPAQQVHSIQQPPLGTSYSYSPNTTDDTGPTHIEHSPEVAQMVGSAAMQASHRRPTRPANPYLQGSFVTRHPMGSRPIQY